MSDNLQGLMILLSPLLLFLLVVLGFQVKKWVVWYRDNASPIRTVKATVSETNLLYKAKHQYTRNNGDRYYKYQPCCIVVFVLENAKGKSFEIQEAEFRKIERGDSGTLVYRGKRYLEFDAVNKVAEHRGLYEV